MFHDKSIVLDANILIRAVLGEKVRHIIQAHSERVKFYTPALCFQEAEYYLPQLFKKRGLDGQEALDLLDKLSAFIYEIEMIFLEQFRIQAEQRIAMRDPNDWSIVACAMLFKCPIWTEDTDFFGTGLSIWTTDRVHLYLSDD